MTLVVTVGLGVLIGIGFMASAPDTRNLALALKSIFAKNPNAPG